MSRYSLGAYRIVLRMRTARTLLVEGETDKTVIQRILLEYPSDDRVVANRPVIDTPTILADNALSGLGHKDQVEIIAASCFNEENKLMALIDREWDDFNLESLELSVSECGYQNITTKIVKTFGHSIENYFFDHATFSSLLRRQIPGSLNVGMLRLIQEQFPKICQFALAYSLAAKEMHLISRLSGLLCRRHIDIRNSDFYLNDEFINSLIARAVGREAGNDFVDMTKNFQFKINEKNLEGSTIKWASHGHLGGEAIWTCIAKILDLSGVSVEICEQIERGMQNDKFKHGADVIAAGPHERRPLEWLARWLLGFEDIQPA